MIDKQIEEIAKEEHIVEEIISMFKYQVFGKITKEGQKFVYEVINNLLKYKKCWEELKEEILGEDEQGNIVYFKTDGTMQELETKNGIEVK